MIDGEIVILAKEGKCDVDFSSLVGKSILVLRYQAPSRTGDKFIMTIFDSTDQK